MRTVFAVLSAFALFLFGWLMLSAILYGLGYIAARAVGGIVIMHYFHLFIIWIVGPGFGGFLATYSTPKLFPGAHPQAIAAGFISIVITLSVIIAGVVIFGIGGVVVDIGHFLIFVAQVAAVLVGSKIGSFAYGQEAV